MKKTLLVLVSFLLFVSFAKAELHSPKREFRAVWLSTVTNIDWPKSRNDSDTKKQNDLRNYLIKLKESGCNAVLLQVRCSCDAMYKSEIEPWSYWFSGQQGKGPDIEWDPLEFAIEEAHKLNMELHAWVNPYRAVVSPSSGNLNNPNYLCEEHVSKKHSDWLLKFSDVYILDPGKAEVRNYICKVFMDIVKRYDIDGLHMDDYFYPYSVIQNEDSQTFTDENRGFGNVQDWRRDNINLLVKMVSDSIQILKPWVKWGISPFGIYRPGVPSGITGLDAYNVLYCDPLAWLQDASIDYLTPQLYWPFEGGQDYGKLMPWWAQQCVAHGRHFYPGQAMYRAGDNNFPRGEIPRQIRLNRKTPGCDGSVFFTANNFNSNPKNTIDSLKQDLYRYPALWPLMSWKDSIPPQPPQNLKLMVDGAGVKSLSWDAAPYSDPADSAYAYIVYRAPYLPENNENMADVKRIDFSRQQDFVDSDAGMYYYRITTVDRNKLESVSADIEYPFVLQQYPAYAEFPVSKKAHFSWHPFAGATQYSFQISQDGSFDNPLHQELLADTSAEHLLDYDKQFSWRVKANNSDYWSPVWVFNTEYAPQLDVLYPLAFLEGVPQEFNFRWSPYESAQSYDLQLASDPEMKKLIINKKDIRDTEFSSRKLDYAGDYYWRIRSNLYDRWNEVQSFRVREKHIDILWERSVLSQKDVLNGNSIAVGKINENPVLVLLSGSSQDVKATFLDAAKGTELDMNLNLQGVQGGRDILRDICISNEGHIYAANLAEPGESFKVYRWEKADQAPRLVYQADDIAYRLGDHISLFENAENPNLCLYAPAANSNKLLILEWNEVGKGFEARQLTLQRSNAAVPCVAEVPGSSDFFLSADAGYLIRYSENGKIVSWASGNKTLPTNIGSISSFSWQDKIFVAAYTNDKESASILDCSANIRNATIAGRSYRLGTEENKDNIGSVEVVDMGAGVFQIYVLGHNNGLAAYRYDAQELLSSNTRLQLAQKFELGNNYPNPFNPHTAIPYRLMEAAEIEIAVYDLSGRHVRTLYQGYQSAGEHLVHFDAEDLSSGIYICRLRVANQIQTQRMTLIK